jgi:hypothetical protein
MLKRDVAANTIAEAGVETGDADVSTRTETEVRPRMAGLLRASTLWALVGACALAAIFGRVALLNLTSGVVGGDGDGYQNLWNNYWVKTALLDQQTDPFYTHQIYYPTGVSLRFHTLNPLNGLLTLPLNLLFGYVAGINLLFVAALALTAFFSYLLIRDLVGNTWAAFAGAAVVTFANPRVVLFFNHGQSEKLSVEWLFLYLFLLFRALPRSASDQNGATSAAEPAGEGRSRWPFYAAGAVVALLLTSLTDWQYLMYAVIITLLYFLFVLFTRRSWREKGNIFARLALIGGGYALVAGPSLLLPMVREAVASPWLSVSYQSQLHALDLFDILGMGLGNPGYLALALALFGLVVTLRSPDRERGIFWGIVALFGYVMALGPTLTVGGQETGIPLPYSILQNLPVFSIGRDPGRFTTVAVLGVGVLAALGLRSLLHRLAARDQGTRTNSRAGLLRPLLVGLFLIVTLIPFASATGAAPVDPPDWPPFYRQIAQDPDNYSILELPLFTENGRGENHYMMLQSLHEKPRFSGRLARDRKLSNPNNFVKRASLFRHFWLLDLPAEYREPYYPESDIIDRTDYSTHGVPILNFYGVRYIVLHEEALYPRWDEAEFQQIISQVLGPNPQPIYTDATMRVYSVPQASVPANPLTLDVGYGWYPRKVREDGLIYRWANLEDDLPPSFYMMSLAREPLTATLQFTIYSFQETREVNVDLDGEQLLKLEVTPEARPVTLDLTLEPGFHAVQFTTPQAALPTGNPSDARLLSFGMYDVALTEK